MKKATHKGIRGILAKVRAADWEVRETKKGWLLLNPDGVGKVTIHGSPSDRRAILNIEQDLRNQGFKEA